MFLEARSYRSVVAGPSAPREKKKTATQDEVSGNIRHNAAALR